MSEHDDPPSPRADGLFLEQRLDAGALLHQEVTEVLAAGETPYQSYRIVRSPGVGRCLVLDGDVQSCEVDEALYHELLVHPAMLLSEAPRRVLVLGGGEGATLREVLRHPEVERAVMVDLDGEVVEACRRHLPEWSDGALDDPRAELVIGDALAYLAEGEARFDVVVGDLVDLRGREPVAGGLYSGEFFASVGRRLAPAGLLATQAGALDLAPRPPARPILAALRRAFPAARPYGAAIPSFHAWWGFALAAAAGARLPAKGELADRLRERLEERGITGLATGGAYLAAAFSLPRTLAERLAPPS